MGDKVKKDFAKAMKKRGGDFDTYVFVHNNRRGMHPQVSKALSGLRKDNPGITFENSGHRRFYNEFCRLSGTGSRTSSAPSPRGRSSPASPWRTCCRS